MFNKNPAELETVMDQSLHRLIAKNGFFTAHNNKDLAVIPITYETADKVNSFFEMRNRAQVMPSNLDYITDNTLFSNLFKHSTIPHYIWLDGKGRMNRPLPEPSTWWITWVKSQLFYMQLFI